jgi:hypothetical protein
LRRAPTAFQHSFTPSQLAEVERDFAPTIAAWLALNHRIYRRSRDLARLLPILDAGAFVDPDEHFAQEPVHALARTESNISFIDAALRDERRRAVSRHWTYDRPRHTQLISTRNTETLILQWMERVVTIRAMPAVAQAAE